MAKPKKKLPENLTPLPPVKTLGDAILNSKTELIRRLYKNNVSFFEICKLTGKNPLFVLGSLDLEYSQLSDEEKISFGEALILTEANSRKSRYLDLNGPDADRFNSGIVNRLINK